MSVRFSAIGSRLRPGLFAVAALAALPAGAAAPPVTITPLLSATTTASGQPIILPPGRARIIASIYVIAPGTRLPLHKHPYLRCAYVLSGTLRVTDTDTHQVFTYRPGAFVVEVIGQWHYGEAIGSTPVRLLVLDIVPQNDTENTVKAAAKPG